MRRVSPREAQLLLESEGYVYLDVRSVPEFEAGHPAGAYNVPLRHLSAGGMVENEAFVAQVSALFASGTKLVVGCKAGTRSLDAAERLAGAGFTHVVDQRAGVDGVSDAFGRVRERGWRAEGLPWALRAEPGRSYAEVLERARS